MANSIENEWQENPKLSFDEALNQEFKKFSVFGFTAIVEQKQKQLKQKYHTIIWSHFKEFFGLPKIIITVLSLLVVYSFLKHIKNPETIVMIFYLTFLILLFYKLFMNKRQQKNENPKWLFKEIIFNYGSVTGGLILLFQILSFSMNNMEKFLGNELFLFFVSCLLVSLSVFGFIILHLIPLKAEVFLNKMYPEYNSSKL